MPIYPPRNTATRKVEILSQRVYEYLLCLEKNLSEDKLIKKAEKVKIAKLNLLKVNLALLITYNSDEENDSTKKLREKYNGEVLKWNSISLIEIDAYCKRTGYEK